MIQLMFAVHDVKAEAYLPPFFLHTAGMAKRIFQDCINDEKHQWGRNPSDYTLFQLGAFNDATASMTLENAPKSLGNGMEYRIENVDIRQNIIDFEGKQA